MNLVQQISAMIETTEPQWLAEKIQVMNWGGFHGPASAKFAPEVTVISGQSGAGKSTLLDAYIALMMPPNVAFNGASNDAGGGRARSADQRNLLSYLRGSSMTRWRTAKSSMTLCAAAASPHGAQCR